MRITNSSAGPQRPRPVDEFDRFVRGATSVGMRGRMSEPYSCFLRATISEEALRRYLAATAVPTTAYQDWDRCTGFIATKGFSSDAWREFVERAGSGYETKTYGALFASLRGEAKHPLFRFYYEPATRSLTQVTFLYGQGAMELVWHLGVTRGIAPFMAPGDEGFLAVHDPFLGNGTVGVIALEAATSKVLDEECFGRYEKEIAAVVTELRTNASAYLTELEHEQEPDSRAIASATRDMLDDFMTT